MRALVDALLRDLHVSLTDISLCYGPATGGPAVSATLSSLQLRCQRRQALPRLLSLCFAPSSAALAEHSCDCTLDATLQADWHPHGLSGDAVDPIVPPWTLGAGVALRIEWPPASAPSQPPGLHVEGSASLGSIRVELRAEQLALLANLLRMGAHPLVASKRCAKRPAGRASGARTAVRWWQFAIEAVRVDLIQERRSLSWRATT